MKLAWGAKVSAAFRLRVLQIAAQLGIDPSDLMACMAFETAETFRPDIRNAAGSGATGLIQFMPSTAAALGTTTTTLAAMTAEEQLTVVHRYFKPWAFRLKNLGDVYGAILWPGMIGRTDDYVVFDKADAKRPKLYIQNAGLDFNRDGKITRAEVCSKIVAKRSKGLMTGNAWEQVA
ncbi:lytic transglycosylase [Caulobacter zeae]|uniref:Lytic transglycosylase n=1 Tax=Caulobacter zeae TaxID=2055137 RepID=A0A2N5DG56_9CAUL|nr:transglycosylase SLT domain-containing protein [Caulobacter zeae]PLR25054.1 lytic transglycosylase [Caulobacter zeae]